MFGVPNAVILGVGLEGQLSACFWRCYVQYLGSSVKMHWLTHLQTFTQFRRYDNKVMTLE